RAPRTSSRPDAWVATIAIIGISSIMLDIKPPDSMAVSPEEESLLEATVMSPTGSPAIYLILVWLILAPMRSSTSRKPERVEFRPTPLIERLDPLAIAAAAMKNAADERSPGTL